MKASGFAGFDAAVGGFSESRTHLLYGPTGAGKTEFCLSFLAEGLAAGESVALVTADSPEELISLAETYGWYLREHLQSRKLRIFEYPEDIASTTHELSDLTQIVEEFRRLLGSEPVERIVLDPITPLLDGANISLHRCRGVLNPIASLPAATLIVVDAEKDNAALGYCKVLASSIMRFSPPTRPGGPSYLRLERHVEKPEVAVLYRFELKEGEGFTVGHEPAVVPRAPLPPKREVQREVETRTTATPLLSVRTNAVVQPAGDTDPRVLLVDGDPARRSRVRADMKRSFTVYEAFGSTDALSLLASTNANAVVLAFDFEGESGIEVVAKLRQTGCNLPIIGIMDVDASVVDQVSALAAGVDVCLPNQVDGRILRLTVFNALCRRGAARRAEQPITKQPMPAKSTSAACTADLGVLHSRLAREVVYSREQNSPFVLLTLRTSSEPQILEELASLAYCLLKSSDMAFVGERGIACLLSETHSPEPFLAAFWNYWKSDETPEFKCVRCEGQPDFLDAARDFVFNEVGETEESGWATAASAGSGAEGVYGMESRFGMRSNAR